MFQSNSLSTLYAKQGGIPGDLTFTKTDFKMACSKEYLCLKLQDHIKIKSHGDRRLSFLHSQESSAVGAVLWLYFPLRSDDFAVRLVGSAGCWTVFSGRTSVAQVTATPGGIVCPVFFAERGSLTKALFSPRPASRQGPSQLQCTTEPREIWALLGFISPFLIPTGSDPKDTSQYTSCT